MTAWPANIYKARMWRQQSNSAYGAAVKRSWRGIIEAWLMAKKWWRVKSKCGGVSGENMAAATASPLAASAAMRAATAYQAAIKHAVAAWQRRGGGIRQHAARHMPRQHHHGKISNSINSGVARGAHRNHGMKRIGAKRHHQRQA